MSLSITYCLFVVYQFADDCALFPNVGGEDATSLK